LQEFYTTITRKIESPIRPEVAFAYVDQFMEFPLVPVDKGIITIGIQNSLLHQISYWDGAIIAAAERLKCRLLYTEDLNHGQRYGSVEVRNPFK
jgi:predicted nucleic acid-binding protein